MVKVNNGGDHYPTESQHTTRGCSTTTNSMSQKYKDPAGGAPPVWVTIGKTQHHAFLLEEDGHQKLVKWATTMNTEWIDGSVHAVVQDLGGRRSRSRRSSAIVLAAEASATAVAATKKKKAEATARRSKASGSGEAVKEDTTTTMDTDSEAHQTETKITPNSTVPETATTVDTSRGDAEIPEDQRVEEGSTLPASSLATASPAEKEEDSVVLETNVNSVVHRQPKNEQNAPKSTQSLGEDDTVPKPSPPKKQRTEGKHTTSSITLAQLAEKMDEKPSPVKNVRLEEKPSLSLVTPTSTTFGSAGNSFPAMVTPTNLNPTPIVSIGEESQTSSDNNKSNNEGNTDTDDDELEIVFNTKNNKGSSKSPLKYQKGWIQTVSKNLSTPSEGKKRSTSSEQDRNICGIVTDTPFSSIQNDARGEPVESVRCKVSAAPAHRRDPFQNTTPLKAKTTATLKDVYDGQVKNAQRYVASLVGSPQPSAMTKKASLVPPLTVKKPKQREEE